ncbi:Phospholipase A1-IIdelta [Morus notabilis]|uniref:Phospholipase A1 n=1 Tax=Morus notabilis TaxID=981085 RepID=W9RNE2_9ROSA|nr:phospholipase A1-IIdelta [Morus notabilis]EXC00254.1 Phospholipase A1-IIdelta [Morus notabilis]
MSATATATPTKSNVSWEELLGSNNWEALLEPELNLSLREFILRCGNFCEATYDAFNSNPISPNCGNSRYGEETFFHDVVLQDASNYQVVAFLYATSGIGDTKKKLFLFSANTELEPWDRQSNWMGFVAVTTDKISQAIGRREVYVVWRGTITTSEWTSNLFQTGPEPAKPLLASDRQTTDRPNFFGIPLKDEPKVHGGWLSIYTSTNLNSIYTTASARDQLHRAIQEIRKKYKGEKLSVVVTGHSLGGSMATLSAFDIAENKIAGDDVLVSAVVFGCPQVGNVEFKELVDSNPKLKILHIHNIRDKVPDTPDWIFPVYIPIQTADLEIDTNRSPYLKSKSILPLETAGDAHNLEANLHVVAWWNGQFKKFDTPKVKRSLALVNKSCRFLVESLKVPEFWWVEKNKGMEYDESTGEWVFDKPPPADQMLKISL